MSLTEHFQPRASHKSQPSRKRPAPFSIRLNEDERARLMREADGVPLAAFIKSRLFESSLKQPSRRVRASGLPIQDRQALGKTLALLGQSRIANNLNQLAHAANLGILPIDPQTMDELKEAIETLRLLRDLLMTALGYRLGDAP